MNDKGHLTGWTAFLIVAGIGMAIAGAVLAPDTLPTFLLISGYGAVLIALNNVHGKIRSKMKEREIRDDERSRITGLPPRKY